MTRRLLRLILAVAMLAAMAVQAQPVAKIAVFSNGAIELDGRRVTVEALDDALRALSGRSGVVWYHRENPAAEPHRNAGLVIQAIVKHRLPVSMSAKPDFSDYVDQNGVSRPRK
jgi:hypothetical protein